MTIELHILADVEITCPECKGKRFTDHVLEIEYRGKNIYDVLQMTVDDAGEFFLWIDMQSVLGAPVLVALTPANQARHLREKYNLASAPPVAVNDDSVRRAPPQLVARSIEALRRALGAPLGLPQPRWLVELGARLLGTDSELVLKSRRVVPGRLAEAGFEFRYPRWDEAARALASG